MIDFDEEIKKFQPSQEVDEAEDAIYGNNIVDVAAKQAINTPKYPVAARPSISSL